MAEFRLIIRPQPWLELGKMLGVLNMHSYKSISSEWRYPLALNIMPDTQATNGASNTTDLGSHGSLGSYMHLCWSLVNAMIICVKVNANVATLASYPLFWRLEIAMLKRDINTKSASKVYSTKPHL